MPRGSGERSKGGAAGASERIAAAAPVPTAEGADAVLIVGVDCAARASGTGLARALWEGGRTRLLELARGRGDKPMTSFAAPVLARWISAWPGPIALGFDAPLGWPTPLGRALRDHTAGAAFAHEPDDPHRLWRRATDLAVKRLIGKTPLEVGADRIARAAKSALDLLRDVRATTGRAFPVTLQDGAPKRDCVFEVYPAAARSAHPGLPDEGKKFEPSVRHALATALSEFLSMTSDHIDEMTASDHVLDAGLCVLAVTEVLENRAVPPAPAEREAAAREGWIWVRSPAARDAREMNTTPNDL